MGIFFLFGGKRQNHYLEAYISDANHVSDHFSAISAPLR